MGWNEGGNRRVSCDSEYMGRLRKKQGVEETIKGFVGKVLTLEEAISCRGNWQYRFRKTGPLVLELGTGKGRFVTESAKAKPDVNFIGLERQAAVLVHAVKKAMEEELSNVLFIWADAQHLSDCFVSGELFGIHINFCDPWPKERHAKRRLTHPAFLARYRDLLQPEGCLHIKTDNAALFEYSLEQFGGAGMEILQLSRDLHRPLPDDSLAMTEYEEKFQGMGVPIHYCRARFLPATVKEGT